MTAIVIALVAALSLAGCRSIQQSAFRTAELAYPPYHGPVQVSRTQEPTGIPLAVVQAYGEGSPSIGTLMAELTHTAAQLGADFVKVDRVATRFDEAFEAETVSYECGTDKEPMTCTQTNTNVMEVATTQVVGRAFRRTAR
jgi:hypothetical protein